MKGRRSKRIHPAAQLAAFAFWLPSALASEVPAPPAGASPQVLNGAKLYQAHCALCHGPKGRDANVFPRPIWGPGHDIGKFGTAKGLFDYVQLLMPFDNPAKIDDPVKTAIVAYMLVRNGDLKPGGSIPTGGDQTAIK
ncbi:MAG: c-type cytochrome [Rubrivivax sp.]|jgi:cytochrome c|nr:cytochrome c [Rubrivivax sp.]